MVRPLPRRLAGGRERCHRLAIVALLALALIPTDGFAQSGQIDPQVVARLNVAAISGGESLLRAVSRELAAQPELAATPARAAALAAAIVTSATGLDGMKGPLFRGMARKIIAAAPAQERGAVARAVAESLRPYSEMDPRLAPSLGLEAPGAGRVDMAQLDTHGFRAGSFIIYPDAKAATFYDDNIYATAHHHVSDWIGTVSPRLALQSDWNRNSLYAEAQTDLTYYRSHPHEDSADWHVSAEGQIDVTDQTRILLGGVVMQEHEDRASPDAVPGNEPTPYSEQNGYAGVTHRFDAVTLRVGTAVERLSFGNVTSDFGEIDNQDRNRIRYTFGGLARYEANRAFRPFVEAMGDVRRYEIVPDQYGFNRNSDGFVAGVGCLFTVRKNISGEAFLGVLHRTYADRAFNALTTPAADATVRWQATPRTALIVFSERTIEETTWFGSPGYIYTLAGARLEQALSGRLTGMVRFSYIHRDFAQVGSTDNDISSSVSLRYRVTQLVSIGIDYRYYQRVSGTALTDFSRNQAFFQISTQL